MMNFLKSSNKLYKISNATKKEVVEMKVIKNIIFVAIVFLISIGLLVVGNGYDMYKDAISKYLLQKK